MFCIRILCIIYFKNGVTRSKLQYLNHFQTETKETFLKFYPQIKLQKLNWKRKAQYNTKTDSFRFLKILYFRTCDSSLFSPFKVSTKLMSQEMKQNARKRLPTKQLYQSTALQWQNNLTYDCWGLCLGAPPPDPRWGSAPDPKSPPSTLATPLVVRVGNVQKA